ncbi:MAG: hypothetical protein E7386_03720 [Ruminococcaceae bacterium]|nr:hypothetical protein [Oscillospiraceae bacterium]
MFYENHRLSIVIGAYGSGKSEIAVNMSLAQRKAWPEKRLLIADLDIINPFYRSSDCAPALEEAGIRVISPMYAGSNVDAPVLPAEIFSIFDDETYTGVFDIGGEDMGATVLGSMRKRIENTDTQILMAVNTLRPFTSDPEQIAQMTAILSEAAGFKIDGYLHNTNLLEETTPEIIAEGEKIIEEASKLTGIPVVATCYMERVQVPEIKGHELFPMTRQIFYNY